MEEQESDIAKEQMLQQGLRLIAGRRGLTHASLYARSRSGQSTPLYGITSPVQSGLSEYESAGSDFTGYADSEIQRRELLKRARELAMTERVRQNLEEHIKQTARGLYDDESGPETFFVRNRLYW